MHWRVWVTGSTGKIGSAVAAQLPERGVATRSMKQTRPSRAVYRPPVMIRLTAVGYLQRPARTDQHSPTGGMLAAGPSSQGPVTAGGTWPGMVEWLPGYPVPRDQESEIPVLGLPEKVRACLFDLDGVLTDTASVHNKAWKAMFDAFLAERAERTGEKFVPFDSDADYRNYVDGKKREDGVRSFLDSRGIRLPDGNPDDPDDAETVYGLGNRKNEMFQKVLHTDGVEVFDGSRRYLEAVSAAGLGIAVVSSSANTRDVLEITGLDRFAQQRVDGITLRDEHIAGKPAPDSYLRAAQLLDVAPDAAAVFEDALSGVAAGRAGNFGFVVGVDRVGQAEDLRRSGADVVVTDLAELLQS